MRNLILMLLVAVFMLVGCFEEDELVSNNITDISLYNQNETILRIANPVFDVYGIGINPIRMRDGGQLSFYTSSEYYKKECIKRYKSILKKRFKLSRDVFYNTTKVTDIGDSDSYYRRSGIYLSFILYDSGSVGSLKIHYLYSSSSWLFIDDILIKTDNNTYRIDTNYNNWIRETKYGGNIYEEYSVSLNETKMIEDIINSNIIMIRYSGDKYYDNIKLNNNQKQMMKNILNIYSEINSL